MGRIKVEELFGSSIEAGKQSTKVSVIPKYNRVDENSSEEMLDTG